MPPTPDSPAEGPLPNRIRELRDRRQMTQEELAAAIGTSKMQVSRLERGERRLTQSWMERIAAARPLCGGLHPMALSGQSLNWCRELGMAPRSR